MERLSVTPNGSFYSLWKLQYVSLVCIYKTDPSFNKNKNKNKKYRNKNKLKSLIQTQRISISFILLNLPTYLFFSSFFPYQASNPSIHSSVYCKEYTKPNNISESSLFFLFHIKSHHPSIWKLFNSWFSLSNSKLEKTNIWIVVYLWDGNGAGNCLCRRGCLRSTHKWIPLSDDEDDNCNSAENWVRVVVGK